MQLEEHPAEDLYERRRLLNQKWAFRRQRLANSKQEQQGDNYDYSNCDLCNVINIGRDARNVIISRRKEHNEIEAYIPSSNYHIPANASASFKKHKPASTRCWRLPTSPSDDARRRQFGMVVFHEPRIDLQAHEIPL